MRSLRTFNQSGFSLVEIAIAAGIASVLALGAGSLMLSSQSSLMRAQSTATVSQTQMLFNRWLSSGTSGGVACAQILRARSGLGSTAAAAPTDVEIHDPSNLNTVYSSAPTQQIVRGANAPFTISSLALSGSTYLRTEGSGASVQKVYQSTLWLEGKLQNEQAFSKRPVTALTLKVDSSGQITDCNVIGEESTEASCAELTGGYYWNGVCTSAISANSDGQVSCQYGLVRGSDGGCAPVNQLCGSGTIAQGYIANNVTGCTVIQ